MVVGSLLQSKMKNFKLLSFDGQRLPFDQYCLIKVSGADAKSFLQGQTTNDITALETGQGHLNTVLNIQGKVEGIFYVGRIDQDFFLVLEKEFREAILQRLDKFLIMEDVVFTPDEREVFLLTGVKGLIWAKEHAVDSSFIIHYCNDLMAISFAPDCGEFFDLAKVEDHDDWKFFTQWPVGSDVVGQLINDSRLNEWAISYSKGCFLGQEVVAKINNNRGSAYYPAFIVSKDKNENDIEIEGRKVAKLEDIRSYNNEYYHSVKLFRDYRVDHKEILTGRVALDSPLPTYHNLEEKMAGLYEYALELSNKESNDELALDYLECCMQLAPDITDAYEVAGVIYGHRGDYQKAIDYMNRLHKRDPKNIMAHTNKSLYYMKLGNLEKAEEEKAKATVLSFELSARSDQEIQEKKKQEDEMILRKEQMFIEVLKLDDKDETAHYGLGEIALGRGQYVKAVEHLKTALEQNKKLSNAYLKLGKAYLEMNQEDLAKEVFTTGVEIAAAQGDMMPANEMQRLLVSN